MYWDGEVRRIDWYKTAEITIAVVGGFYAIHKLQEIMKSSMGPDPQVTISAMKKNLARRLKRPEIECMVFNSYEALICTDVVCEHEITTGFAGIGGMVDELEEIRDNVILPIQLYRQLNGRGEFIPCPTGVLLYGKPGTGKTLTARAIAKEAGATFVSVKGSTILNKWVGESDKLVTVILALL